MAQTSNNRHSEATTQSHAAYSRKCVTLGLTFFSYSSIQCLSRQSSRGMVGCVLRRRSRLLLCKGPYPTGFFTSRARLRQERVLRRRSTQFVLDLREKRLKHSRVSKRGRRSRHKVCRSVRAIYISGSSSPDRSCLLFSCRRRVFSRSMLI